MTAYVSDLTMPDRPFNCCLVYYTPGGARAHFRAKTIAPDADRALDIAHKLLHNDKRRDVFHVVYQDAIG